MIKLLFASFLMLVLFSQCATTGTVTLPSGWTYTGDLVNGMPEGHGRKFYQSGKVLYEGDWKQGKKHGQGIMYYDNGGMRYQGEWADDRPAGHGTSYYENGKMLYEGEWLSSLPHGHGKSYYENGNVNYIGEWANGEPDGPGTSFYSNGKKLYEGNWVRNKKHGKGTAYHENGNLSFEGNFREDAPTHRGISYDENGRLIYATACTHYRSLVEEMIGVSDLYIVTKETANKSATVFEFSCAFALRSKDQEKLVFYIGPSPDAMYRAILEQIETSKRKLKKNWLSATYESGAEKIRFDTAKDKIEMLTNDRGIALKRESIRRFSHGIIYMTERTLDKEKVSDWEVEFDPRVRLVFDSIN